MGEGQPNADQFNGGNQEEKFPSSGICIAHASMDINNEFHQYSIGLLSCGSFFFSRIAVVYAS